MSEDELDEDDLSVMRGKDEDEVWWRIYKKAETPGESGDLLAKGSVDPTETKEDEEMWEAAERVAENKSDELIEKSKEGEDLEKMDNSAVTSESDFDRRMKVD